MPRPERPRVAVLGAGPVGLEAALAARRLGLPVAVYERGRVGEHVRRWGHVRMFSQFGLNSTPLGLAALRAEQPGRDLPGPNDFLTGKEYADAYLEPLAQTAGLLDALHLETQVTHVGRAGHLKTDAPGDPRRAAQPFKLLLREGKGRERVAEADVVLDCTGTYGQACWLGEGGIPAPGEQGLRDRIAFGPEDVLGQRRPHYAGKTVLVVGAGYSAATNVCDLAALAESAPETWVIWLARGPRTDPLVRLPNDPLKERDRLAVRANWLATRGDGNVEFHANSSVTALAGAGDGFQVTARVAGEERTWNVERIIANVGFTPDRALSSELQVHECYATLGPMALAAALAKQGGGDCLAVGSQGPAALKTPEPNFFILGQKSYGRNSHFLLRTGFEQVREAFGLVVGKPDLDLAKV
jgi:hypothetical protein